MASSLTTGALSPSREEGNLLVANSLIEHAADLVSNWGLWKTRGITPGTDCRVRQFQCLDPWLVAQNVSIPINKCDKKKGESVEQKRRRTRLSTMSFGWLEIKKKDSRGCNCRPSEPKRSYKHATAIAWPVRNLYLAGRSCRASAGPS